MKHRSNTFASPLGPKGAGARLLATVHKYWFIYLLAVPGAVFLLLFSYAPMYGILLAWDLPRQWPPDK